MNDDIVIYRYIDEICSSYGNFRDISILYSKMRPSVQEIQDFLQKRKNIADVDLLPTENIVSYMEVYLKKKFGYFDITCANGMQHYLNGLLEILPEKYRYVFRLKDEKIEQLYQCNPPNRVYEYLKLHHIYKGDLAIASRNSFFLTRLLEDQNWLSRTYDLYGSLCYSDFMADKLSVRVLERKKPILSRLEEKNTVWEDKISGTIFAYPCTQEMKVPYLRSALRTIHYAVELNLHSEFSKAKIPIDGFGNTFKNYLSENSFELDFFEPHALFEDYIWGETLFFLKSILPRSYDGFLSPDNYWWVDDGSRIIKCNNIIDYVSNISQQRREFPLFRAMAMHIKKSLYCFLKNRQVERNDIFQMLYSGKA